MAQDVMDHGLNTFRSHILLALKPGMGPGATIQGDSGPRAGAVLDPTAHLLTAGLGITGCENELDDILFKGFSHMQVKNRLASPGDRGRSENCLS